MATPVDPLFLLLPLLEAARSRSESKPDGVFVDIAEALVDDRYPALEVLAHLTHSKGQLDCICEKKTLGSNSYYRLQDERVHTWLDLKVPPPLPLSPSPSPRHQFPSASLQLLTHARA